MIDLLHGDCMVEMQSMLNDSVDFTLTDIPYNVVNRKDNGLRTLDKGNADVLTQRVFSMKFIESLKTVFVFSVEKNNLVTFINILPINKELHVLSYGKKAIPVQ